MIYACKVRGTLGLELIVSAGTILQMRPFWGRAKTETDGNIGIGSKSPILIPIVSVSVSIGGFSQYRYQSRYPLGAFLSPGISPGIY